MSSNLPFDAADIIRARKPGFAPRVALILGSGLGVLAEQMTDAVSISYADLSGFPISTVHGHAGELVLGELAGVPVACMKGRGHFYEHRSRCRLAGRDHRSHQLLAGQPDVGPERRALRPALLQHVQCV
jgi:purine nucleoside phosphorylase